MTLLEFKIKKTKEERAWKLLFDAKDACVEAGWEDEAVKLNEIISDRIPF